LSEIQAQLFVPGADSPRALVLTNATADFNQDGWTIRHALDGDEKTAWGVHPREGETHQAIFELAAPLEPVPRGSKLVLTLKQLHGGSHLIGRPRLAITDATLPLRILPTNIQSILQAPATARNEEQRLQLAAFTLGERVGYDLSK